MEPTEAQQIELWERCGLIFKISKDGTVLSYDPKGVFICFGYPPIDLNNLFEHAPLVCGGDLHINFHEKHFINGRISTECILIKDACEIGRGLVDGKLKDVAALALFWAIWEVKNGNYTQDNTNKQ